MITQRLQQHLVWTCCGFAVLLVVAVLYFPVTTHHYLEWDDLYSYVDNPHLHGFNVENVCWLLTSPGDGIWKPLTYFSFMVEFWLVDARHVSLHLLVNPFIHAMNAVLVGWLAITLLRLPVNQSLLKSKRQITLTGLFAAIIFAIHPVNVEAVAWLSGRKELLAASFYLLSVLCWMNYLQGEKRRPVVFWTTWIFAALSFLCKSLVVSLPLILLLLDHIALRQESWTQRVLEKWPFWLLSLIVIPVALWGQAVVDALPWLARLTLLQRIDIVAGSYAFYLSQFLVPTGLLPYYAVQASVGILHLAQSLLLLLAIVGLAGYAVYKKHCALLLVTGWYLIIFLPVSGLIPISSHRMADRYAYLPLVSFCLAAGYGVTWLLRYWKQGMVALVLLLFGLFGWTSHRQIAIWASDRSLWEYTVTREPDAALPALNLGVTWLKSGKPEIALPWLRRAAELAPDDVYYLETWMMACAEQQQWLCAQEASLRGLQRFPQDLHFLIQHGYFSAFQGAYEDALESFNQALARDPENISALWGKANSLVRLGRQDAARDVLHILLRQDPAHSKAHQLLEQLHDS